MKTYVKPELFYENFELSQHIATCAWDMPDQQDNPDVCIALHDKDIIPWPVPLGPLFNENNELCETKIEQNEIYCYTNGSAGSNVFNS